MTYPNQINANAMPVRIASPDFDESVGFGMVPGFSRIALVGHSPAVNIASAPVDLCEQGTVYPWLATAQTLQVSSASTSDASSGTGAQTVLISGLNSQYAPILETVTLNGTATVNTVNQYLRVNTFVCASAGSSGQNAGDITLQMVGGGSIQGIIRAGICISQQAVYTVPAGYTALINSIQFSMPGSIAASSAAMAIWSRATTVGITGLQFGITTGFPFEQMLSEGLLLQQKTDVTLRVLSVTSDGTEVAGGAQILLGTQAAIAALTGLALS